MKHHINYKTIKLKRLIQLLTKMDALVKIEYISLINATSNSEYEISPFNVQTTEITEQLFTNFITKLNCELYK